MPSFALPNFKMPDLKLPSKAMVGLGGAKMRMGFGCNFSPLNALAFKKMLNFNRGQREKHSVFFFERVSGFIFVCVCHEILWTLWFLLRSFAVDLLLWVLDFCTAFCCVTSMMCCCFCFSFLFGCECLLVLDFQ